MRYSRKDGKPSAYEFACGAVERVGEWVTIEREHGVYLVKRNPNHPAGWAMVGAGTVKDARKLARAMAASTEMRFTSGGAS